MSIVYMTETEQLEQLKTWWKRHNQMIIMGLSMVLLVFSGFKYWVWHNQKIREQASTTYEHMMVAFSNQDNKAVRGYANQLVAKYSGTVYADTARLTQAKLAVETGHYDDAKIALKDVAAHSKFKILVDVARLRLARVLVYQKSYDLALQELDQVTEPTYEAVRAELRGDIERAKGKLEQALQDYQSAKVGIDKYGVTNIFLDMKQHELLAVHALS